MQEWSTQSMHNIKSLTDLDISRIEEATNIRVDVVKKIKDLNRAVKKVETKRVVWQQVMAGFGLTIGQVQKKPVHVHFSFAIINGKKVCFYECTSRMADHTMIEDWLMSRFQLTHDDYTRRNHVNATNFHNCINSLDNLDKEPRDTVYKKR